MDRKDFIKAMGVLPLTGSIIPLQLLSALAAPLANTPRTPVYFFGHGNPMNAIELNDFSLTWRKIGKQLPKPNAILCISAHWETKGTFVTANEKPKTIHDFGGFPQALFDVQYPAPGKISLAKEITGIVRHTDVGLSDQWGLDHGCWSVLTHLFPDADVPVLQLSLDYTQPAAWHFTLGKQLSSLRRKGIMIIGSGNMVHNLRMVDWSKRNEKEYGFDWALEAQSKMKDYISKFNFNPLIDYKQQGKDFQLAIPTPEHYLPLLYCLALRDQDEQISFFNDKAVMGSLTMTSLRIHA